jgi:hypothetical protein
MRGESCVKELWKIPLARNTERRRILDISDNLCIQLIDQLKTSRLALQVDETTDVFGDSHLLLMFLVCWKIYKEDFSFVLQAC